MQQMNPNSYSLAQLLADETFVNFCMERNAEHVKQWTDWLQQHPEQEDLIRDAKAQVILLTGHISETEIAQERKKILDVVTRREQRPAVRISWWWAAACVVFMGLASYLLLTDHTGNNPEPEIVTLTVPARKFMNVTLADGSRIRLSPTSTLSYPKTFRADIRTVTLDGDACFDVKHDARWPFVVKTAQLNIEVLGTSFNVNAFAADAVTKVSLFDGLVNVSNGRARPQKLIPGYEFSLDKSTSQANIAPFDRNEAHESMQGLLVLKRASWDELRLKLARKYNVVTFADPTIRMKFSGKIFNESIEQVVDKLNGATPYHFRIKSDTLIVSSK